MYLYFKNLIIIVTISLLISCHQKHNLNQIKKIEKLEEICYSDQEKIDKINIEHLKNVIKIAEFNLLSIEQKKIDSLDIELIYFEYRDYLIFINDMKQSLKEYQNLKNTLTLNKTQLHNLKSDYSNSNMRRIDLNNHLLNEAEIIKNTSEKIEGIINLTQFNNEKFDSLSHIIETFINEN
tara:strand:+ start:267 stop:806 length:540 start_codon:yes stop_codon:yes gene_type:complete